jgi:hypothetical protein
MQRCKALLSDQPSDKSRTLIACGTKLRCELGRTLRPRADIGSFQMEVLPDAVTPESSGLPSHD